MNFDEVSDKHLHEIERLTKELLEVMRKAKLLDQPLTEMLRELESQAEKARRERFDEINPQFRGY
jgi:hypothetical protein